MRKSIYIYMTLNGYDFDKTKRNHRKDHRQKCKPLKSKTRQFTIIFRSFLWLVCVSYIYELSLVWTLDDGYYCFRFCFEYQRRILMQSKCMGSKVNNTKTATHITHTKYMITSNKTASTTIIGGGVRNVK